MGILKTRSLWPFIGFAGLMLLSACGSSSLTLGDGFDESTGLTLTSSSALAVFASPDSRYSRSGRDYLYLGPVEINRQGNLEYFLWVGVASTLDRGYLAPATHVPRMLFVQTVDGPMEIILRDWNDVLPGIELHPYRVPVELSHELAARVTLSQLALLRLASPVTITVVEADDRTRQYQRWDRAEPYLWPAFAAAPRG